jgi:hypothetical protein
VHPFQFHKFLSEKEKEKKNKEKKSDTVLQGLVNGNRPNDKN